MSRVDAYSIYKCSVGRTEITEKTLRRRDLEDAVMARKESILRQTELSVLATSDHECIVLVEREVAAGLRPCDDMQRYSHGKSIEFLRSLGQHSEKQEND